nr:hypothetical protein [Saprospiraceae bacterium]
SSNEYSTSYRFLFFVWIFENKNITFASSIMIKEMRRIEMNTHCGENLKQGFYSTDKIKGHRAKR